MTVRIGELALAAGVLTPRQLDAARVQQKQGGGRLGAVLVSLGYVTEQQVTDLVARQYGLPAVNDLDSLEVPPKVLALVPREPFLVGTAVGTTSLEEVLRETVR